MLDGNINKVFKFSSDPNLTRWNPLMEIETILEQLVGTYGCPTPNALLQNDTHFQSVYSPKNAPEILFCRIKDCQEIQILGDDPYTPKQLLNNAIQLLLGCGLYQRNFKKWDCKIPANKIWINLKPFIQEAYQCCLNVTTNTADQHGYVKNAFATLGDDFNDDNDVNNKVATVTTHLAALTMQSQLTAASTVATTASVTTVINQLT